MANPEATPPGPLAPSFDEWPRIELKRLVSKSDQGRRPSADLARTSLCDLSGHEFEDKMCSTGTSTMRDSHSSRLTKRMPSAARVWHEAMFCLISQGTE